MISLLRTAFWINNPEKGLEWIGSEGIPFMTSSTLYLITKTSLLDCFQIISEDGSIPIQQDTSGNNYSNKKWETRSDSDPQRFIKTIKNG